jgi:hypothetical protein
VQRARGPRHILLLVTNPLALCSTAAVVLTCPVQYVPRHALLQVLLLAHAPLTCVGAATATGDGDIMMRFLPSYLAVAKMKLGMSPGVCRTCGHGGISFSIGRQSWFAYTVVVVVGALMLRPLKVCGYSVLLVVRNRYPAPWCAFYWCDVL